MAESNPNQIVIDHLKAAMSLYVNFVIEGAGVIKRPLHKFILDNLSMETSLKAMDGVDKNTDQVRGVFEAMTLDLGVESINDLATPLSFDTLKKSEYAQQFKNKIVLRGDEHGRNFEYADVGATDNPTYYDAYYASAIFRNELKDTFTQDGSPDALIPGVLKVSGVGSYTGAKVMRYDAIEPEASVLRYVNQFILIGFSDKDGNVVSAALVSLPYVPQRPPTTPQEAFYLPQSVTAYALHDCSERTLDSCLRAMEAIEQQSKFRVDVRESLFPECAFRLNAREKLTPENAAASMAAHHNMSPYDYLNYIFELSEQSAVNLPESIQKIEWELPTPNRNRVLARVEAKLRIILDGDEIEASARLSSMEGKASIGIEGTLGLLKKRMNLPGVIPDKRKLSGSQKASIIAKLNSSSCDIIAKISADSAMKGLQSGVIYNRHHKPGRAPEINKDNRHGKV